MYSVCESQKPPSLETFAFGGALSSDSLVGQTAKNLPARQETPGLSPGLGRSPGERNGNPLQLFVPGEVHGQRSPVGYSPWGCKELDMIE